MESKKVELYARLANLQKQAEKMAATVPSRVAKKLIYNASLEPTILDFNSNFEFYRCRLDVTDNSQFAQAASLIEELRLTRQKIHNLLFAVKLHRLGGDAALRTVQPITDHAKQHSG